MATGSSGKKPAKTANGLSKEEIEAMKEHIQELNGKAEGEDTVLKKIASMPDSDRIMGRRLHDLIRSAAPSLNPRLWYGMPAYAKGEKIICFFQNAGKFKARYSTLGFSDKANLDDGNMWPTSFAIKELTVAEETRIATLVKRAIR